MISFREQPKLRKGALMHGIRFVSALLLMSAAGSAKTQVTYNFVGGAFIPPFYNASCPPTCRLTGSFTLAQPLPPNLTVYGFNELPNASPISFSFTDGLTTITDSNAGSSHFGVATDANGAIIGSFIRMQPAVGTGDVEFQSIYNPGFEDDVVTGLYEVEYSSGVGSAAGRWCESLPPNSIQLNPAPCLSHYLIVDPYPSLVDSGREVGTIDTKPDDVLAKGRTVAGVAADGVSHVLIALQTRSGLPIDFTNSGDGCLFDPTQESPDACHQGGLATIPITPVPDDKGIYYAIVGYIAPVDFEATTNTGDVQQTRQVIITADDPNNTSISVQIVRPPIVLIHGIWSSGGTWSHLIPHLPPFSFYVANYSGTSGSSVTVNDPIIFGEITSFLTGFRSSKNVAAAQVDVVAHSMGGLVTRQVQADSNNRRQSNYMQGPIHKLITVGTPYAGSPFADALIRETTAGSKDPHCYLSTLFSLAGLTIGGAVHDLSPQNVQQPLSDLPMHAIVGVAGLGITNATEGAFPYIELTFACPNFINSNGATFNNFFGGPNDLIVPVTSQKSGYSADPSATETITSSVSHAVIPVFLGFGPAELGDPGASPTSSPTVDEATYLAGRIQALINTPVTDPAFFLHDQ
jgi:pimeloyl-ACP methyl ester carboxylesterase